MLAVDASVLAVALIDEGPDGALLRARLRGEHLVAPALIDLEVCSVWRGLARDGRLDPLRVQAALSDLQDLPLHRVDHRPLLHRCWQLRENLTVYDAAYVAVAETLGCTLITGDARLAHAPGTTCVVDVIARGQRSR